MESTTIYKQAVRAAARTVAAVLAAVALAACSNPNSPNANQKARQAELSRTSDMQTVAGVRDSGIRAAIVVEHTIYSYHFVTDSDSLNGLGERDLAVLASHYKAHGPGLLNIYRDGTQESLYSARVQHVMQALKAYGVDTDKLHVTDGPAGGPAGMSVEAARDLKSMRDAEKTQYHEDWQSSGSSSGDNSSVNGSMGGHQ